MEAEGKPEIFGSFCVEPIQLLTLGILRGTFVSPRTCCGTCEHCALSQAGLGGWCRMRQLSVPQEMTHLMVCQHWTGRAPSLPPLSERRSESRMDRQLELGRALTGSFEFES